MLKKKKVFPALPKRPESIAEIRNIARELLDLNFDGIDVSGLNPFQPSPKSALDHVSSQMKLPELPKTINQRNGESS